MDSVRDLPGFELRQVAANGISINVATVGAGRPILLLHGWPHTWFLWRKVMAGLSGDYRIIAPDLRGIGGTTRATDGYDLQTLSDDAAALLRELDAEDAVSVGIDAGAPVAWMLAMRRPEQIRKLVVMESLIGLLPGAEDFLRRGPPWWFGFHGVPGLAETVVEGHEDAYLGWFFRNGTFEGRGIEPAASDAFAAAYRGRDALRCGFEYYRAGPANGEQIGAILETRRVTLPTMAIGGNFVGDALLRQLQPISDDLIGHVVPACGHIIPEDQPDRLVALLREFIG